MKTILLGKFTVVYKQSLYVSMKSESYIPELEIKLILIWYISIYKFFKKFGVSKLILSNYAVQNFNKEYNRTNVSYIIKCFERNGSNN